MSDMMRALLTDLKDAKRALTEPVSAEELKQILAFIDLHIALLSKALNKEKAA